MESELIKCPSCGSEDINIADDPSTTHSPAEHNWWGQCHRVTTPMRCEGCKGEFTMTISGYKNRVSVSFAKDTIDAR